MGRPQVQQLLLYTHTVISTRTVSVLQAYADGNTHEPKTSNRTGFHPVISRKAITALGLVILDTTNPAANKVPHINSAIRVYNLLLSTLLSFLYNMYAINEMNRPTRTEYIAIEIPLSVVKLFVNVGKCCDTRKKVAVTMPDPMKVAVAISYRGWRLAMPFTIWPDLQPLPATVPITNKIVRQLQLQVRLENII